MKAWALKSTFLRRFSSVVVLGCATFGAVLAARADYLYWTLDFDEPQSTTEAATGTWPKNNPASNDAYVWLTVYDTSKSVGDEGYRTVIDWAYDENGQYSVSGQHLDTTVTDPDYEHVGGGLGWPGDGSRTAWNIVDISDYNNASFKFAVEMGATYGEVDFFSEWYTAAQLAAMGYTKDAIGTMETPWNPAVGTWSVPEPSSGLLMLLGGALMALRRRRRA